MTTTQFSFSVPVSLGLRKDSMGTCQRKVDCFRLALRHRFLLPPTPPQSSSSPWSSLTSSPYMLEYHNTRNCSTEGQRPVDGKAAEAEEQNVRDSVGSSILLRSFHSVPPAGPFCFPWDRDKQTFLKIPYYLQLSKLQPLSFVYINDSTIGIWFSISIFFI